MSSERFDVRFSPAPREAVRLLYISKSRFGGDWHSIPHTHSCTELFYCLSGAGQFNIEGRLHPVSPDDMVIVNPQVEHTELSLNANPLEYIALGIEGVEFLFNGQDNTYTMLNCRAEREEVLFLLRGLLKEINLDADGCEVICQDLLEVLLIRLVRANSFTVRPCSEPIRSGSKECAVVRRYLEENFKESVTLDQLAEVAHINKYYLSHSFQQEYGVSPIAYAIRCRLRESRHLLENTDHSLSQISEMLGFSSLSYFSQCFHKAEGISPNEYRRQVRRGALPSSKEN